MAALAARTSDTEQPGVQDWSLCWWTNRAGKPGHHTQVVGESPNEFWSLIERLLQAPGDVWCLGYGMNAMFTSLGGWVRLCEGTLVIQGRENKLEGKDRVDGPILASEFMLLYESPFLVKLKIPGRQGRIVFLDTRNYGVQPTTLIQSAYTTADETSVAAQAIVAVLSNNGGPSIAPTAATVAWNWFRQSLPDTALYVHNNSDVLRLERDSLHGGRCEAWTIGKEVQDITGFDVSAAYPSVCCTTALPARLLHYGEESQPPEYGGIRGNVGYIADCTVEVCAPCVPYRKDGLTVWPVGRFRTQLCQPEIMLLQRYGAILKWHRWATYECETFLQPFQHRLWQIRQRCDAERNVYGKAFVKALAVSICGKFGQRLHRWEDAPQVPARVDFGTWIRKVASGGYETCRSVAWNTQRMVDRGEAAESMPAIAAWVYAEMRVRLWSLIQLAGPENVVYVDTDSLFVRPSGKEALLSACGGTNDAPGNLRMVTEDETFRACGVKHYTHGSVTKRAGVHLPIPANAPHGPRISRMPKPGRYLHGRVHEDGSVTPFEIWE